MEVFCWCGTQQSCCSHVSAPPLLFKSCDCFFLTFRLTDMTSHRRAYTITIISAIRSPSPPPTAPTPRRRSPVPAQKHLSPSSWTRRKLLCRRMREKETWRPVRHTNSARCFSMVSGYALLLLGHVFITTMSSAAAELTDKK